MEKFIDTHTLTVRSGSGAPGAASFRREKFVPRGGPDGGDGGKGGDVIFHSSRKISSFIDLHPHKKLLAENGIPGYSQKRHGKDGKPLIIEVPVGTIIKDENGKEIFDFIEDDLSFLLLKGGAGGKGNCHFISSTNQAPDYAQHGLPGSEVLVHLEIKLIADVGLVGFPNAGKSTFISVVTNAKPKIASYPFTTLCPKLGMLKLGDDRSLVIADIPGIIPDAHKGKGLGLEFLRHIERTKSIFYLIEAMTQDPYEDFLKLQSELQSYSDKLGSKNYFIGISKMDLAIDCEEIVTEFFPAELREKLVFFSSATNKGIELIKKRFFTLG